MNDIDLDFERTHRIGFAEVVYGEAKSAAQIREIAGRHLEQGANLLVTRCSEAQVTGLAGEYDPLSRTFRHLVHTPKPRPGLVGVIYAGSSDAPVAREALRTLEFFGCEAIELGDCGVAGRHRLLGHLDAIARCTVVICCAGFEGALPSVLGGMLGTPIIAVPTSVGYGVAKDGRTALNAMLASCASGITVMNIDNGCGAAMAALRILGVREP